MTAQRMCELGRVSRASLYRFEPEAEHPDENLDLRDELQRIALEFPCYGRPRITAELKRRGWAVNHKRVGRIMREDNLLCRRKRKFVVTTDSNHNLRVNPNLAGTMELSGLDQLWRADITYIRLETEFVYLAVAFDAYSRRVIGWALDRDLEDDLANAALQMAFRHRAPTGGLTHHSDRGVQYASNDYTDLLQHHGVRISMSRRGNPYDAHHDGLLGHALELVRIAPPIQLTLRRAVSTAYDGVFHFLISEATSNWGNASLRTALGGAYDHGVMKTASNRILSPKDFPFTGEDIAAVTNLRLVPQTFNQLQEDRHFADYNLTEDLDPEAAFAQVKSAEEIFNRWPSIRGQQIAQAYLVSLLVKRARLAYRIKSRI